MAKRDPVRTEKLRRVIRYMLERESLAVGHQAWLGQHFNLTRQRVHQVVTEERRSLWWRRHSSDLDSVPFPIDGEHERPPRRPAAQTGTRHSGTPTPSAT